MPSAIKKLLIANRGEIACRIIRTCQQMGIETIAVCSEADRFARHTQLADAVECLGGAAPAESYLNAEAILAAAGKHGADAIHPGYGFLAENADFAEACARQGLIFVGAPVAAMRLMASKAAAKQTMEAAGVPCIPGYHGDNQDTEYLLCQAEKIGWPVLIKATAGGGGKGMKIVRSGDEFPAALESARSEARKAFGDDRVILEKFITRPRHLEVQVFSDSHGHHLHLFERDCSAQRRYQKIIEEAPAAGLAEDTRQAMHAAAIKAAAAVDYQGAGTVEFILDEDQHFYFLEMNTRLQVEHRVTEMITGTDLVAWQIRVAEGHPLPLTQEQLKPRGHSIEARLYAEDAENGFLPSVGVLERLRFPPEQPAQRIVDTGVRPSDRISIHYDPMIAKLVVWGANRREAIQRMTDALRETLVSGVKTNLGSLLQLVNHPLFVSNQLFTTAIDQGLLDETDPEAAPLTEFLAALIAYLLQKNAALAEEGGEAAPTPLLNWTNAAEASSDFYRLVLLQGEKPLQAFFRVADETLFLAIPEKADDNPPEPESGQWHRFPWPLVEEYLVRETPTAYVVTIGSQQRLFGKPRYDQTETAASQQTVQAPMPGQVLQRKVAAGERVQKDQTLAVMEAMKMELSLKAPRDAVVAEWLCAEGDLVQAGDTLLRFTDEDMAEETAEDPVRESTP